MASYLACGFVQKYYWSRNVIEKLTQTDGTQSTVLDVQSKRRIKQERMLCHRGDVRTSNNNWTQYLSKSSNLPGLNNNQQWYLQDTK